MLRYVRRGDTVACHSMDRLARNLDDLRTLVTGLTKRSIQIRFVKENLTFTGVDSLMANLLLSLLGAVSQFERELIKERQREGIAVAKRNGVDKGRKRCLSQEQAADLRKRIQNGERKTVMARQFSVSREPCTPT